ncbi:hypothetical protein O3S80_42415 [Streptomyces sp. Lzd4kr]|nr:hypothetical protein [Streptomyces sp. Lzd4kr]
MARFAGDPASLGSWVQGKTKIDSEAGPISQTHPAEKRMRCGIPDSEVAVAVSGPVGHVIVAHGLGG